MTQNTKSIIYIAGAGRSGSTLLDIALGCHPNAFSAGELDNLFRGIKNEEYCSCHNKIHSCKFWSIIFEEWKDKMITSPEEYEMFRKTFLRNKATIIFLYQLRFGGTRMSNFISDMELLYDIIFKYSKKSIIIDSSKVAHKILILRRTKFQLKVVHLKRDFLGVLGANNKVLKKNIKNGIELDILPQKTSYVFITWFLDNILSYFFTLGNRKIKVDFRDITSKFQDTIQMIYGKILITEYKEIIKNRGPFSAPHMTAGNRLRMNSDIYIREYQPSRLNNLRPRQIILAKFIDFFF